MFLSYALLIPVITFSCCMDLSQGLEQIGLKFYQYEHLNSIQTVSIHTFSASTVLSCTKDSRDPYSSTSSGEEDLGPRQPQVAFTYQAVLNFLDFLDACLASWTLYY